MNWIQQHLLTIVVAALPIGAIAAFLFQAVKRNVGWVDNLPGLLKPGAVYVLAALLTSAATVLGVPLAIEPGTNPLASLDQNTIAMMLEAALALAVAKLTHKKILQKPKL